MLFTAFMQSIGWEWELNYEKVLFNYYITKKIFFQ